MSIRATVSHFELPAEDLERAASFYRAALGWEVEQLMWDGPPYFTVHPPEPPPVDEEAERQARLPRIGAIRGGLGDRRLLGSDQPVLVIHLHDGCRLEEALAQIVAAGGKAVGQERLIEGMGRFALFADTEGNHLGLWEAA